MCDSKPFYELIVKEKIEFLAERERDLNPR